MFAVWLVAWMLFWGVGGVAVIAGSSGHTPADPQWIVALRMCESEGRGADRTCWADSLSTCPSPDRYCRAPDGRVWTHWH